MMLREMLVLFPTVCFIHLAVASRGDNNTYHKNCLVECLQSNCTDDGEAFKPDYVQPLILQVTFWTCKEECRYYCMWKVVDEFLKRDFGVPQFYGKWPFLRIWGLQEPASVLFSLLNLAAHFITWRRFTTEVPPIAPFYWLWQLHSFVCIHAWLWSAIFHARDVPFTEKMDYVCAFSIMMFSLCCLIVRTVRQRFPRLSLCLMMISLSIFILHAKYLLFVKFDYGYNMMANIVVGLINSAGWLVWCWYNRNTYSYVWRCFVFVLLSGLTVSLEVLDFPPVYWLVDAHALWHLSTAGLPFLFYRFVIDDCNFLLKTQEFEKWKIA